jgi:diaminopimelate epimerase
MKLKSHLLSGAGNTFHICYDNPPADEETRRRISVEVCRMHKADGYIFLKESESGFVWDFFNNDGSRAEMCGNATRCVGYYARNILQSRKTEWKLQTTAGPVIIQSISDQLFKIQMTPIVVTESAHGFFANTGVPHLVIEKAEFVANEKLRTFAEKLRHHADFLPGGTNVTFVSLAHEKEKLRAVSFERGVENFTLACGTGAAAAAAYNLKFRGALQTEVEMPGGTLIMDLSNIEKPVMTGPAVLLGSYEYDIAT